MLFRPFAALVVLGLGALPAFGDVEVRLSFSYVDPAAVAAVPSPDLAATNLSTSAPLTVLAPESAPEGTSERIIQVTEADFDGPYARLRLALSGLRLPPEDAKADRDLTFAFEIILRRDLVGETVMIEVPVIVSSRKGAMKPLLADPPIAEELAGRFFLAQQYMSAYQAAEDAVAAAPGSFALHRLIARAMADFALQLTGQRAQGVQVLPAEEMARDISLYWQSDAEGKKQHLRAYSDARTFLWHDLAETEAILGAARSAGIETVQRCAEVTRILDYFDRARPMDSEARKVDLLFPNPGSLEGYLAGRRLDVKFICSRPKI